MTVNTRAHKRIPFDALGYLILGEDRLGVQTVNVSRNGACLRMSAQTWTSIEDLEQVTGRLNLGGEDFNFEARVCWSAGEKDQLEGQQFVQFGLEFLASDAAVMEGALQSISIVHEEPPMDSFNI